MRIKIKVSKDNETLSIFEVDLKWRKDNKFSGNTQFALNQAFIDMLSNDGEITIKQIDK